MISRLVPDASIGIGHGQMDGKKLEKVMLDFMDGKFDVLVATSIIESGLDVPNANTIQLKSKIKEPNSTTNGLIPIRRAFSY